MRKEITPAGLRHEAGQQNPFRRQRNLMENGKGNEREAAAQATPS
jgi:hypothetical protein